MKHFLTLFICLIIFHSSVDAQYQWIERKYDKPVSELTDYQLNGAYHAAKNLKKIGTIFTMAGSGSLLGVVIIAGIANNVQNDITGVGIGLYISALLLLPSGVPMLVTGSKRMKRLDQFKANHPDAQNLTIHPVFFEIPGNNSVASGLSMTLRF